MKVLKTVLKILLGLILIGVGVFSYFPKSWGFFLFFGWWKDLLVLIKGAAGLTVALIGLVVLALAKE